MVTQRRWKFEFIHGVIEESKRGGTKCDKCGHMINGGRRKLKRHKRDHHGI